MASIQIRADIIIEICEKCKKYWDEKERVYIHAVDTPYIEALEAIGKIKKLAEYAVLENPQTEPSDEDIINCVLTVNEKSTITIDHKDFELIGEFL